MTRTTPVPPLPCHPTSVFLLYIIFVCTAQAGGGAFTRFESDVVAWRSNGTNGMTMDKPRERRINDINKIVKERVFTERLILCDVQPGTVEK